MSGAYLPTLLDRLAESPASGRGPASRGAYEQAVLRDLRWLLNSTTALSEQVLSDYPMLASSVLNFGIRSDYGSVLSEERAQAMAAEIRQAICAFEPRVLRESVSVSPVSEAGQAPPTRLAFRICLAYWYEPYPLELSIRAEWDVECGLVGLRTGKDP